MNAEKFDNLRLILAKRREEIVNRKRPEYTEGNPDVLNNFKVVAAEMGISPKQVWYVYFRKHISSIAQCCGGRTVLSEPIVERISDAMNYLDLLYALELECPTTPDPYTTTAKTTAGE